MKVYFGIRSKEGCKVFWWDTVSPDRPKPLPMAQQLRNHSPDGPEWGFAGSGPAQLALALLYHCTGDVEFTLDMYQEFKRNMVAILPPEVWARTELDILACACDVAATPELEARARQLHNRAVAANRKRENTTNG